MTEQQAKSSKIRVTPVGGFHDYLKSKGERQAFRQIKPSQNGITNSEAQTQLVQIGKQVNEIKVVNAKLQLEKEVGLAELAQREVATIGVQVATADVHLDTAWIEYDTAVIRQDRALTEQDREQLRLEATQIQLRFEEAMLPIQVERLKIQFSMAQTALLSEMGEELKQREIREQKETINALEGFASTLALPESIKPPTFAFHQGPKPDTIL